MDNTITIRDFLTSKQGKAFVKYFAEKLRVMGDKSCKERAWIYVILFKAYDVVSEEWDCDSEFADWKLKPEILEAKPGDIYRRIRGWATFSDSAVNILSTNDKDALIEKLGLFEEWLINKPWQLNPEELQGIQ